MLDLGKGIAEYEDNATKRFLFEKPYKYNKIIEDDFQIISGRKGAGKSTIVDYQKLAKNQEEEVIVVRPKIGDELFDTACDISQTREKEYRTARRAIAKLFEFIVFTMVMRHFVKGRENQFLKGGLATVYDFLTSHGLIDGSVIRRSLDFLSDVTEDYKKLNRLFSLLGKAKGPKYNRAKEGILGHLKKKQISTRVFIDDIDGFGFEYNADTKAFLEALVICCMKVNLTCIEYEAPLRLIITPPTELLDNANFWNRDKIMRKTAFLRWNNLEKLRSLINKRISAELDVKKRRRRSPDDIYSVDPKKSWGRLFPDKVYNKVGSQEETLNYIARHTFYSPRTVLDICTEILSQLDESDYTLDTLKEVSDVEWSTTIQDACEEKSVALTRSVLNVFSQIYPNVEAPLNRFEGRPNIWTRREFTSFLSMGDMPAVTKTADSYEKVSGDRLVQLLYTMGFIGYAFPKPTSPPGAKHYELAFSYVKWTQKRKFELVVISPVFYDSYNMQPIKRTLVVPHEDLKLTWNDVDYIHRYSHRTNAF